MTTSKDRWKPVVFFRKNDVIMRVPVFVKEEPGNVVRGEDIVVKDEFVVIGRTARVVGHGGL
jgi:hypothetical protein